MSDKKLNKRQIQLLPLFEKDRKYSVSELMKLLLDEKPSLATLRRDLIDLNERAYLERSGQLKGTKYRMSSKGLMFSPLNPSEYCGLEVDQRNGFNTYNFALFQANISHLFTESQVAQMAKVTQDFKLKSEGASDLVKKKELERFVIELSWKSSKIEGNTYSLLDTERLILDGVEAKGHEKSEAIMILNHKSAFHYILAHSKSYSSISPQSIIEIHRLLVKDLGVSFGIRSRMVGITGSSYKPLSVPSQIEEALDGLCSFIQKLDDPYSCALMLLLGISYIQPFEDGNKRTARLMANAILISSHLAPLSYRSVDSQYFKKSILVFYERNSLIPMREIFF